MVRICARSQGSAKFISAMYLSVLMPLVFVVIYAPGVALCVRLLPSSEPFRLPRSISTMGGLLELYWMLCVNTYVATAYTALISFSIGPDHAMLLGVLMIMFMQLAGKVSDKLSQLSFLDAVSLWALTNDADVGGDGRTFKKRRAVKCLLGKAREVRKGGGGATKALELALPSLSSDEEVLAKYGLLAGPDQHTCERALLLTGTFVQSIAWAIQAGNPGAAKALACVLVSLWGPFNLLRCSGDGRPDALARKQMKAKEQKDKEELDALIAFLEQMENQT